MYTIDYEALENKWAKVLDESESVGSIRNPKIRKQTALMLENQFKDMVDKRQMSTSLNEAVSTSSWSGSYGSDGAFHKIALPMVRRTFPEIIAHDLVGVQPMAGPVGIAFALRFKSGTTYGGSVGNELGYNTIDPTYTGDGASLDQLYNTTTNITASSGTQLGTYGMSGGYPYTGSAMLSGEALGSNAVANVGNNPGIYGGLGIGTGQGIKEVNLTLEKQQVNAVTRKLKSRWSVEVAQDLRAMHGLEVEKEMMDILAYEITAEIDREIMNVIRVAANANPDSFVPGMGGTLTWSTTSHFDGRWEQERYRNLFNRMVRMSNKIAISTRRGSGNVLICDPTVSAAIEATSSFTIAPVKATIDTAPAGVSRIGSLEGRMNVFRDTFAPANEFVLGYKGSSPYDAGIIYLPYVQLMFSKVTLEESFNPAVGVQTRYGIMGNMFGSQLYYNRCIINGMP